MLARLDKWSVRGLGKGGWEGQSAEAGDEGLAQSSLTAQGDSLWEEWPGLVDRKLPRDPQKIAYGSSCQDPQKPTLYTHTLPDSEPPEGCASRDLISRKYTFR